MDVITDTNSLRGAGLDSPAIKALAEYLRRTRSKLIIPAVVREELLAQLRINLRRTLQNLDKARRDLHKLVPSVTWEVPIVDENAIIAELQEKLTKLADTVEFVENIADDLPEMVRRLANRIVPASSEGEEARDVLIWLITKRLCATQRVALVTNDKTFYQNDVLNPILTAEIASAGGTLEMFSTVDDFLREHSTRTSVITEEWIKCQIDSDDFSTAFDSFLDKWPESFLDEIEGVGDPSGYSRVIQIVQNRIEDFFVSDLDHHVLYVSVTVWAELELEVEYYKEQKYRYYGYHGEDTRSSETKCIYPCVTMQVQFEVSGETVKRVLVASVERA